MKALPAHPSLYQINARVRLTELSGALGRPAVLDHIPDAELDRVAEKGFDWVWFLSVWRTGAAAQRISRSKPNGDGSRDVSGSRRGGHRGEGFSRGPRRRRSRRCARSGDLGAAAEITRRNE
jgi:hypothetical protein